MTYSVTCTQLNRHATCIMELAEIKLKQLTIPILLFIYSGEYILFYLFIEINYLIGSNSIE